MYSYLLDGTFILYTYFQTKHIIKEYNIPKGKKWFFFYKIFRKSNQNQIIDIGILH